MWQEIIKLSESMKEVSTSNKFILKRLNQMVLKTDENPDRGCCCRCHHAEDDRKEVKALKERVRELEDKDGIKDMKLNDVMRASESMQELFKVLQDPKKVLTINKNADATFVGKARECGSLGHDACDDKEDKIMAKNSQYKKKIVTNTDSASNKSNYETKQKKYSQVDKSDEDREEAQQAEIKPEDEKAKVKPANEQPKIKIPHEQEKIKPADGQAEIKLPIEQSQIKALDDTADIKLDDEHIEVKPVDDQAEEKQADEQAEIKQSHEQTEIKPATNEQAEVKPSNEEADIKPSNVQAKVKPADERAEIKRVDGHAEIKRTYKKTEEEPADEQAEVKPAVEQTEIKPANEQAELTPADKLAEIKPADEQAEIKPADEQAEVKPADDQAEVKPANAQAEVKAADGQKKIKRADEHAEIKRTDKQAEVEPADEQAEIKPTDEQPGIRLIKQQVNRAKCLSRPNFLKKKTELSVSASNLKHKPVIRQTKKKYHTSELFDDLMKHEVNEGRNAGLMDLGGVHTVIIIDISASMADGNAWDHVCTFFNDFINGLDTIAKEHPGIEEEHVAIVVFGHKIECIQRLTNSFDDLKKAFGRITLGGPSPMIGGINVGLGAAATPKRNTVCINEIRQYTKIFIISDGRPTDRLLYHGPDVIDPATDEANKLRVMQEVEARMINAPITLTVVPVGDADYGFLNLLTGVADGAVVSYTDGGKLARRTYLLTRLPPLSLILYSEMQLSRAGSFFNLIPDNLSSSDKDICKEIIGDVVNDFNEMVDQSGNGQNKYKETKDDRLPSLGSRVIRGPDWKWMDQDSKGPGTVIGHGTDLNVYVEWDANGYQDIYRYGRGGNYDLLLIEEYRIAYNDKLDVGCLVTQGPSWRGEKTAEQGVVIRKLEPNNRKFEVRWQDGTRGTYIYGEDGVHEVEPSFPTGQTTRKKHSCGNVLGFAQPPLKQKVKTVKNKNKNAT